MSEIQVSTIQASNSADTTGLPAAVRRVIDGMTTGDWEGVEQHLTPDVFHDGSAPGWRTRYRGVDDVVREMRSWPTLAAVREQTVTVAGTRVAVEIEAVHDGPDGRMFERFANFFEMRDGRIAEHRYYCCGEWNEATVRRIEAEAPRAERPDPPIE